MRLASLLSHHVFHPLLSLRDGSSRFRILRQLRQSQWLPQAQLRATQLARLRAMVRYAGTHSPYYERVFGQHGFNFNAFDTEAFRKLPLLTKADIRNTKLDLLSREYPPDSLGEHRTGGSTGVSLTTHFDQQWLDIRSADALRADQWAGCLHGMKIASIWGNPPVHMAWRSRLRALLADRFMYLDTMNLNERSMDDFIARWRRELPEALFGHSHSLYMFARHVLAREIPDLRPRAIISTSMMLLAQERVVIEKAFGCKVTDRYGCEEVGLIACECEQHAGFHLNIEHLYIEFLRPDGSPADPGTEGVIVVTDLFNRGMPFIRYRIEDVGVPSDRECPCGRGLPLMERVTGRVADYLKRSDGSLVAGVSLVERTLTAIPGIEQMQIVQHALEEIVLNVVRAPDYSAATEQQLLAEFRAVFGPQVRVKPVYMDRIPQERSGKYRFSICKI
jgi:phenylacetate-CoA ligase